ncbi:FixH family protein [Noviherbaspirillum sedimenti]|uniref:Nitrogen fixation protein FixH n=1 Tax=Noviherbaspirillum sedimenti TaxID=2320865 RepID=A0A3A3GKN8_9BURK|nr:FixH family protein [Noviherbaspirillum sedimenti]RJG01530.1 hypothetical protein D3878_07980 [Noviherbaspirillum sedimenti]
MESIFTTEKPQQKHWYQEPWMLLVIGGPAIVIVASFYLAFLAYKGADHVIAPDYYKRGLAINVDIRRDMAARERGLEAGLQIDESTRAVSLRLSGQGSLPPTLALRLSRPAGEGTEEIVLKANLLQAGAGVYRGKLDWPAALDANAAFLWQVNLDGGDWRLTSGWYGPIHAAVTIKPAG